MVIHRITASIRSIIGYAHTRPVNILSSFLSRLSCFLLYETAPSHTSSAVFTSFATALSPFSTTLSRSPSVASPAIFSGTLYGTSSGTSSSTSSSTSVSILSVAFLRAVTPTTGTPILSEIRERSIQIPLFSASSIRFTQIMTLGQISIT